MADLNGRTLKIGLLPGSKMQTGDLGGEQAEQASEALFLINLLSAKLNFTFQLVTPAEDTIGYQLENGSWSGLIGLLRNQEIDMAAARVPFLPELKKLVEFSLPMGMDNWVTLQQQPLQKPRTDGLLMPFRMEVWITLAVSVALMGPVMFAMYKAYIRLFGRGAIHFFRGTLDNFVLFVCVSLIRQDHNLFIRIHSQRILMATWWIIGLLLTTFYTANLTASMARPSRESIIQHPKDLLLSENQHIRWIIIQGDSLHALLQSKTDGFYQMLRQQLESGRGKIVTTTDEAARLVKEEDYVWFGSRDTLLEVVVATYQSNRKVKNMTSSDWCSFIVTEPVYLTIEHGFAFPINSSIKSAMNTGLRRLDQVGITTYIRQNSSAGSNPCALKGGVSVRAMKVSDFFGLFMIAGAGIVLASLAFVGERLRSSAETKKRQLTADRAGKKPSPADPLEAQRALAIVKPVPRPVIETIKEDEEPKPLVLEDITDLLDSWFYQSEGRTRQPE